MSPPARQTNGYLDATRSTGNPRDVEYQLFTRITGRLNRASLPQADFAELVSALDENLRMWRELALTVAEAENCLPRGLRAQLYYLYEFTAAHTQKVLRKEAEPSALIDINMSVMRGLRAQKPGKGPNSCVA